MIHFIGYKKAPAEINQITFKVPWTLCSFCYNPSGYLFSALLDTEIHIEDSVQIPEPRGHKGLSHSCERPQANKVGVGTYNDEWDQWLVFWIGVGECCWIVWDHQKGILSRKLSVYTHRGKKWPSSDSNPGTWNPGYQCRQCWAMGSIPALLEKAARINPETLCLLEAGALLSRNCSPPQGGLEAACASPFSPGLSMPLQVASKVPV